MEVNPNNGAPRVSRHSERRPARTAGNVKNRFPRGKIEPAQKRIQLVSGQPAVLPNILPKSLAANLGVELRLKVPVVGVVMNVGRLNLRFRSAPCNNCS